MLGEQFQIIKSKHPKKFIKEIKPSFSETDMYGHINTKHYFDYVITSRWLSLKDQGMDPKKLASDFNIGFYTKFSEFRYKKPIEFGASVRVESFVESFDHCDLKVPFKITTPMNDKIYSYGKFIFTCIDTKTGKPTKIPDWALQFFTE